MAYSEGSEGVTIQRYQLRVAGIVQGVGFRPLVYRLAQQYQLSGHVSNQRGEVIIEVEGTFGDIQAFLDSLSSQATEPMRIQTLSKTQLPPIRETGFRIHSSKQEGDSSCYVLPADLALCDACAHDMSDPDSRFYRYPFTSCTDCGPRYTVIEALPYDRGRTALASFPLCEECLQEYENPHNRRFHAQSIACPRCGPQITLLNEQQKTVSGDWLETLHSLLGAGKIIALKGLGGFHLVCDASNEAAIKELRRRKNRSRKPLALMGWDIETIERYFYVSPKEREVILTRQAPITLLQPKPELGEILPLSLLAPGIRRMGVMLPYTPLHQLMFDSTCLFVVATSGNKSGCPIAQTNEEALRDLRDLADGYVLHNRDIVVRADDSVGQVIEEEFYLIRRSRGFVPEGIPFPIPATSSALPVVLGMGGEMKNTFCLLHNGKALLSHHVGEVDKVEGIENYRQSIAHVLHLVEAKPDVIGYDPHPAYRVSQEREAWKSKHSIAVYHHHAHMTACMAEHMLKERVIGCILDGTGYGRDGTMWGFEILVGDYLDFERVHSLKPLALPGGETAIRNPWLLAVSCLYEALGNTDDMLAWAERLFSAYREKMPFVMAQLDGRIPVATSSGAGRLFDAVSALLGICVESSYEGEAAMLLGELIGDDVQGTEHDNRVYPFYSRDGKWHVDRLFLSILEDFEQGVSPQSISRTFHHTIAEMVLDGAKEAREKTGIRSVVLSGGVWNNRYLLSYTKRRLQQEGFTVYTQQKIPAGDGGIAFGQAVSALWRWHQEHVSFSSSKSC
ncbi:carbamoyltransferase HypF [Aneurinibacillus uraniidurans]|uniref:carbamoyltransferase HypF n=1 Tax=Aneurinibacillus uraniidurans TaxID=2966586 RepID=UPI00234A1024|nr:carbamoyltransferase HypF [Aneurinibacillus sp. B1]WCN39778.1 carbamoyltransferase HypF [Aneurinibacillus sp. B1]